LKKGRIIKLIGGLYTVVDDTRQLSVVKPRGVFRYRNLDPKVGDFVMYDEDTIHELLPRFNDLNRPSICNIDQALLISSSVEPDFSSLLLDKFLAMVEFNHILPVIVITKIDLLTEEQLSDLKSTLEYYQKYYKVIFFSTKTSVGLEEIKDVIKDKVNVLTGQTGAGKSSLLNTVDPTLNLATNEISKALGRGKHTTRHVELIPLVNGWIADTPGFSKLEFYDMEDIQLKDSFPDLFQLGSHCRFNGCFHQTEPGCAVKQAVEEGTLPKERYLNYIKLLEEIRSYKIKY